MADDPTPCRRCGQAHASCKAHKRDGQPCGQRAMRGQDVCRMHGGKTPVALEAAKRRTAAAEATAAMRQYGEPVADVDPAEAVMDVLRRTVGHVAWLGVQVAQAASITQLDMSEKFEKPSVLVELYERERDRVGRLAKAAHDMGIADRQIRLEEQRGELMAGGVMWLLARLGADDERGRGLAAVMFQALAAGQIPALEEA